MILSAPTRLQNIIWSDQKPELKKVIEINVSLVTQNHIGQFQQPLQLTGLRQSQGCRDRHFNLQSLFCQGSKYVQGKSYGSFNKRHTEKEKLINGVESTCKYIIENILHLIQKIERESVKREDALNRGLNIWEPDIMYKKVGSECKIVLRFHEIKSWTRSAQEVVPIS